ncbi:hypothetical protein BM221_004822 [Beauveria bassiana]|uniref:Uncharacterized protein n=1 Tax=Beauveria bassiana TaxID=176275 RepID=A0A2N6NSC9_BEABA|nr:hypothetical protein BM221_004822 [Beauveria bassiana]
MTVNKTPVLRSMEVNRQMPAARGKTSERFQKSSRAAVEKVLDAGLAGGAGLLRTPAALFFCVARKKRCVPVGTLYPRQRGFARPRPPMLGWSRMPLQQRAW